MTAQRDLKPASRGPDLGPAWPEPPLAVPAALAERIGDEAPSIGLVRDALFEHIGRPKARTEDARLVTGRGRFTDDVNHPGQAHAAILRAPVAHARIAAIDTSAAKAAPGVLAVLTAADLLADGLRPIPHNPVPSTRFDMKLTGPGGGAPFIGPHHLLAVDKVRHVGEAVAMVVAETLAQAQDALERIDVVYEDLPFVLDGRDALAPGAPAVWDAVPDNVLIDTRFGDWAATDRAFASAAHVVEAHFHLQRVTAVPMEPRAALAAFDAGTGRYALIAGSGGAVRQKGELREVLNAPPEQLRVQSPDVGGNFGARNRVYAEFGLTLWAARRLGRPVKYRATRSEAFLSDYQGRDLHTTVALALDAQGRFLALRADNISNVGARCASLSPLSKGSGLITGSYHIPAAALRARAVFTNTMCTQAYRSSGRPEVTYAIERLVDMAAEKLGVDRLALRRRNLVPAQAMPYQNAVGSIYDSGDYALNMDRALALIDWDGFEPRRAAAAARGKLLGRGFANYVESSIGSPRERAEITIGADGATEVVIGTQPSGQGHETSFAQVISDMLQIPFDQIRIILGDTDVVSVGGGSHSGRSMRHAGAVIAMASEDLVAEAARRMADLVGAAPYELAFEDGRLTLPGSNHAMTLAEIAEASAVACGPLHVARTNEMHTPVYPNGAAACEIEIDPQTGAARIVRYVAVDDVGRCINPLIVHGQTHGGIAQGVGQALWEQCVVDPDTGQPLTGSFMDYTMPRSDDLPYFATEIVEMHSPTNPLGVKAGGEGGTTPALAVIVSGVLDALRPLGVRDLQMPLTSDRIWRAIQAAKTGRPAAERVAPDG